MEEKIVVDVNGTQLLLDSTSSKVHTVKKIAGNKGETVKFPVLMIVNEKGAEIGKPRLDGKVALFEVVKQYQGEKLKGFDYKAKARYRRRYGSREDLTDIKFMGLE